MQVIGLTGGIASGKSTVSYYLITHGYEVIDADDISRHALEPGTEAFKQVIEHFPVLDNGIINRQKLADIIFNNQDEKNYLEGILHPYIRSVIVQKIKQSKNNIVFIDVPLLFEAGWDDLCDSTIVVSCDKETQIQRRIIMSESWLNLEGKTVIVTGGASGIGKAVAQGFLNAGSDVFRRQRTTCRLYH